jgi:hypothetical protein
LFRRVERIDCCLSQKQCGPLAASRSKKPETPAISRSIARFSVNNFRLTGISSKAADRGADQPRVANSFACPKQATARPGSNLAEIAARHSDPGEGTNPRQTLPFSGRGEWIGQRIYYNTMVWTG